MATYRRFHKFIEEESVVNRSRIATGQNTRPQTVEALQWHTGEDTLNLSEKWLEQLEDGDYIVLDFPAYPYVWKRDDFEANTEFLSE